MFVYIIRRLLRCIFNNHSIQTLTYVILFHLNLYARYVLYMNLYARYVQYSIQYIIHGFARAQLENILTSSSESLVDKVLQFIQKNR